MFARSGPVVSFRRPPALSRQTLDAVQVGHASGSKTRSLGQCACGGGCPRCDRTSAALKTGGDTAEREADHMAANAMHRARSPAEVANRLGVDPASVNLHTGPRAAAAARSLDAHAYTIGSDIVFADGKLAPHSPAGGRLLAHELAHVAQQQRSGAPMVRRRS